MSDMTTKEAPPLHRNYLSKLKKRIRRRGDQAIGQLSQKVVVLFSEATPSWMFI